MGVAPLLSQEEAKGGVFSVQNKERLLTFDISNGTLIEFCSLYAIPLPQVGGLHHGRKDYIFSDVSPFPLASILLLPRIFSKLEMVWATQAEGFAASYILKLVVQSNLL